MLPSRTFIDDFFYDLEQVKNSKLMKCDIYEQDNNYIVEIDVPGFNREDINLEYESGYLKIKVEKEDKENDEKKYIHRERKSFEHYERSFYIGNIEEDKIKANFENGILKLTLPKEKKETTSKIIEID